MDWPEKLQPFYEAMDPHQKIGSELVVLLNAAASGGFKSQYRRRWWTILEERTKLCAMMSTDLRQWSSCLSSRLEGKVGRNKDHRRRWAEIVGSEEVDHHRVLDALEHDTPVLVGFAQGYSDARREIFEAERAFERGDELSDEQEELL